MPTQPISDEAALERYQAYVEHGNNSVLAGKALGMGNKALMHGYREAVRRGLHLSHGARSAINNAGLSASEAKGGWIHNYDDEGKKTGTTRWTAPELTTEEYLERLRGAFDTIPPATPVAPPESTEADLLGFFPSADLHLGMAANSDQTGRREYNRQLAAERFKAGVSECLLGVPRCVKALIVDAGDAMHSNDNTDRTPRSGHQLKVEGTHHQNLGLLIELNAFKIDLALQHHGEVEFRAIGGNHDPNIPSPLLYALRERYRLEPRVEIVVSENEFWQMNWGVSFLSGHHGHNRKPQDVCRELPGMYPREWGAAKQWHYFSAHLHNYQSVPYGPVRHHQLPSVCSLDTHAAWGPYPDTAGMLALTFHREHGLKNTLHVGL